MEREVLPVWRHRRVVDIRRRDVRELVEHKARIACIIVRWKPNPWGIIAAGAIGSVIGRYILTLYMPHVSARIFRRWENADAPQGVPVPDLRRAESLASEIPR